MESFNQWIEGMNFGPKPGFTCVDWQEVEPGDEVYIGGGRGGPYTVVDKHQLMRDDGTVTHHMTKCIWVKDNPRPVNRIASVKPAVNDKRFPPDFSNN